MTAIAQHRRLGPLRETSLHALNQQFEQLNALLREMQIQTSESRGLMGDSVTIGRHLDVQGNRVQNVGATRKETDAPSVRELRVEALYARGGIHDTDKLILARGGIRTVTPALAPNDLITLGQVQALIDEPGTATSALGVTDPGVTFPVAGWTWPQATITVVNGVTNTMMLPAVVFVRITGPTAPFSIGGFDAIADGRFLILQQTTPQTMTLLNENAGTPAANRITTNAGGDMVMDGPGMTMLLYSQADSRWWSL